MVCASARSPRTGISEQASGPHMPAQCRLVTSPATNAARGELMAASSMLISRDNAQEPQWPGHSLATLFRIRCDLRESGGSFLRQLRVCAIHRPTDGVASGTSSTRCCAAIVNQTVQAAACIMNAATNQSHNREGLGRSEEHTSELQS